MRLVGCAGMMSTVTERTRSDKASEGKKLSERKKLKGSGDRQRLVTVEVAVPTKGQLIPYLIINTIVIAPIMYE